MGILDRALSAFRSAFDVTLSALEDVNGNLPGGKTSSGNDGQDAGDSGDAGGNPYDNPGDGTSGDGTSGDGTSGDGTSGDGTSGDGTSGSGSGDDGAGIGPDTRSKQPGEVWGNNPNEDWDSDGVNNKNDNRLSNQGPTKGKKGGPLSKVRGLAKYADFLIRFAKNPIKFIRGVVFGTLFAAIAEFLAPIFSAISTLALGSQPATFAAAGETLGLGDVPVLIAETVGGAFGGVINTVWTVVGDVIAAAIPNIPGPFELVIAAGVVLIVARFAADAVLPSLVVGLEAVPVVGGPLSTLLGMVISE